MKIICTVLLALVALLCVLVSDFLLQKLPQKNRVGKMMAKSGVRMTISYVVGISAFLVGIKVFAVLH